MLYTVWKQNLKNFLQVHVTGTYYISWKLWIKLIISSNLNHCTEIIVRADWYSSASWMHHNWRIGLLYFIFQAGLVISIGMFVLAYFVVGITVLSISAIATNGAVKEGGAYCILNLNKRNIRSFTWFLEHMQNVYSTGV